MTPSEEIELSILTEFKKSKTRYMTKFEQDRYKFLMRKKFGNKSVVFEYLNTFSHSK